MGDEQTRVFIHRINSSSPCYSKIIWSVGGMMEVVGCVQALEHSAHEMRNEDPGKVNIFDTQSPAL